MAKHGIHCLPVIDPTRPTTQKAAYIAKCERNGVIGITADQRTKYDAVDQEYPWQRVVNVLNKHNFPGDPPPVFKFLVDKRNPAEFMQDYTALAAINEARILGTMGNIFI